ncbi:hypothetical protein [Amycolatopsis endophytica]|uniref:hypothetical protein n=1 Tax=Amycolatopsis endophytica TaxID=860233 RepID=UPI0015CEEBBD|nr:hypothetical protein [Amycolatopsis endophytica]
MHESVLKDVEKDVGDALDENARRAMADHFWCEVFAQLAHAVDEGLKLVDKVPDWVAEAVIKARQDANRMPLEPVIVKSVVKNLWKHVKLMTIAGLIAKGKTMVLVFRVLAVLICKSPDHHRAVVEYCVNPLGDKLLADTRQRLAEAFQEWLVPVREPSAAIGRIGDPTTA